MLAALTLPDNTPCSIAYHVWGEGNSKNLFCVHGLTRNGMDFEVLGIEAAEKGFRVIAPDMPGRGASPRLANPAMYNNAVNASLCLQLIAKLGITQVDWLGTSMGGMIAMLVANQSPGTIRKLILNDVGCVITSASLKRIGEYVGNAPSFQTFAEAEAELKNRTLTFGIPAEEWEHFAKHSIEHTSEGFRLAYDPAIAQAFSTFDPGKDIELWPLWEAMNTIPIMLIRGEHSDLLTEPVAEKMQATHTCLTRLNIAGVGHAPSLMTRTEINSVLGFLA